MTSKDHSGLGIMRIPLFFGAMLFFIHQAVNSWERILTNNPTEILANTNVTLITTHSNGLVPNGNFILEVIFGVMMVIASVMTAIGLYVGIAYYLRKEKY